MLTFSRFVIGSVAALILGASVPAAGTPATALPIPTEGLPSVCDVLAGLTPDVWQGAGVTPGADDQWDNDANWSLGIAPLHLSNPYVCVPAGGLPVIRGGQDARLVALDVASDAVLQVKRRSQASSCTAAR